MSRKAVINSLFFFQTNITKEWWSLNPDRFDSSEDFPLDTDDTNDDKTAQAMIIIALFSLSAKLGRKEILYLLGVKQFLPLNKVAALNQRYGLLAIAFDHQQTRCFDGYDAFFKFYGSNKGQWKRTNELFVDLEKAAVVLAKKIVEKVSEEYKDLSSLLINLAQKEQIDETIRDMLENSARHSDENDFPKIVFNKLMN